MSGHIAKKGTKYWVVLNLSPDPVTKKRRRKWDSSYDRKKDATVALAKLVTDVNQGKYVEPTKETFGVYLTRWLPTIRSTVRANTWESYRSTVETHLIPHLGDRLLTQLDRRTFSTLYDELGRTGRKDGKGGLSSRSVRMVHVVGHKALDDAVMDGLLFRNPTEHAEVPQKVRSATPSWPATQVRQFLDATTEHRLHGVFFVLANTGMRRSEALGLHWADVNLEAGTLAVRTVVSLDRYRPYLAEPKTPKSRRVVALDPETVRALKSQRARQAEDRLAAGEAWTDNGLVFADQAGGLLNPQAVSGTFDRLVAKTGLPAIGLHGLRHSHASMGLAAGVPLVLMSERLGHHSVALTGDVYSHSLPSQHHDAAATLAALLSAPTAEVQG